MKQTGEMKGDKSGQTEGEGGSQHYSCVFPAAAQLMWVPDSQWPQLNYLFTVYSSHTHTHTSVVILGVCISTMARTHRTDWALIENTWCLFMRWSAVPKWMSYSPEMNYGKRASSNISSFSFLFLSLFSTPQILKAEFYCFEIFTRLFLVALVIHCSATYSITAWVHKVLSGTTVHQEDLSLKKQKHLVDKRTVCAQVNLVVVTVSVSF